MIVYPTNPTFGEATALPAHYVRAPLPYTGCPIKTDPLRCFAKISITSGLFQPNLTHTCTQQRYTCLPFLVFDFKVYRV